MNIGGAQGRAAEAAAERAAGAFVGSLDAIRGERFDCVVVGGGIHGACLLLEVARRGGRALLVERGDFGRGASARSLRILHGGLRYLQSLDLARYGESVRARSWFLRTFPELTAPCTFLLPLDGRGLRRPAVFRAAFLLDDLLSRARNDGLPPAHRLPRGRVLRPEALRAQIGPLLASAPGDAAASGHRGPGSASGEGLGLTSAASWSDGWIDGPQRLLFEMLRWSGSLGARIAAHTELVGLDARGSTLRSVLLRRGDDEIQVATPRVILAPGAWTEPLLARLGLRLPEPLPTAMAFNLALEGGLLPDDIASGPARLGLGIRARDGRNAFLWGGRGVTLVGTVHTRNRTSPDETRVTKGEAAAFLGQVGERLPGLALQDRRVLSVTVARLPARSWDDPEMPHRDRIHSGPELGGPDGLTVVVGLKYTTAPEVAARVVARLGLERQPSGGDRDRPASRGPLRVGEFLAAMGTDPTGAVAALQCLAREEGASTLADLVLGRLDGSEDPRAVRALSAQLAPYFVEPSVRSVEGLDASDAAIAAALATVERALEPQLLA